MSGQFENYGEDYGRLVPIFADPSPLFSPPPYSDQHSPDAARESADPFPVFPSASVVRPDTLPPVGVPSSLPGFSEVLKQRSRRRWVALSIVLVVLLVLGGATGLFFYVNRSNPDRTLDNFCTALQQGNYQTAYQQFSHKMQDVLSERTLASAFTQDRLTQCIHDTTSESGTNVQTNLMLVHISKKINTDRVTLTKDEGSVWRIDDVRSGSSRKVPSQAVVHHLTLSAKQMLRDLTGVFESGGGGADTGILVMSGERVVMFASGFADVMPGGKPTGPGGSSLCSATLMPEPSLSCYSVIYSLSFAGHAAEVGAHTDFTTTTDGTIFLGINASGLAQASGSFQLTIITVPDGTATGIWQAPDNGFFMQGQSTSLSVQIFSQHDFVSSVSFFLMNAQGGADTICSAAPSGTDQAVCTWGLTVAGIPITNGPITLGFSIDSLRQLVRNPDGMRMGTARYVRTEATMNWAGYGAEDFNRSTHYQSATLRWTVPQIQCAPGENSAVVIWPGLTGVPGKSQLAQTGTGSICQSGTLFYYAWWEMYPAPPVLINDRVLPGDVMMASVIYQQGQFQLILDDESEHWHFSTAQAGSDNDTITAVCIAEAPFNLNKQETMQLSQFGSANLTCQVNNQPIGVTGPQNVVYQMVGAEQHAIPSTLDQQGANFTVQWKSN